MFEAGNQTLVGEVPASFVYSDIDYDNTRRCRIKQSDVKCIRIIYTAPSFNLTEKRENRGTESYK